ncbi:coenzyme PQQ synthesis protein D (PqqD) [Compostimonas suwonensis]|uniref:Coenzyme PQQ synthesis protein D (PqqD) n=2 Tax=Compostimonas suwonensis TaxID=1048394 RepID=A0A2M9C541_9MICO|nr:coenzyme PQQ synthesis protein D (PqqD) [Compostimonas suwonensis]
MIVDALGSRIRIDFAASLDRSQRESLRAAWAGASARAQTSTKAQTSTGDDAAELVISAGIADGPATATSPASTERADVAAADTATLASALSARVTLAAIERQRGRLLMLHACGLVTADGAVLAFVGPSGRGKTTAARALGSRYGYVSDETIAVDASGTVLPYRKPLSVIEPASAAATDPATGTMTSADAAVRPKRQLAPSALGLLPLPDASLRLGGIILLDRRPGAGDPRVEEVPLAEAIAAIVPEASYFAELPRPLRYLATLIERSGGVRRVVYGEADHLAAAVPELLTAHSEPEGWEPVDLDARTGLDARTDLEAAEGYRRGAALDAIAVGPELLVLSDGVVHVLSGIGPQLWLRAGSGASETRLLASVVELHGLPPHGDAAEAVSEAIARLLAVGLLEALGPADGSTDAPASRWRRAEHVAAVDSGDRVVVLDLADPASATPQALAGSAAAIWRAIGTDADGTGGRDTEAIVAHVAGSYAVEPAAVRADVEAFLRELRARALVREIDTDARELDDTITSGGADA